jgi:hypothetical protein
MSKVYNKACERCPSVKGVRDYCIKLRLCHLERSDGSAERSRKTLC